MASYEAVKVSENVYWVGAIDWGVRDFHGYLTQRGTTYNAYLVTGSESVLVDTVKGPFYGEMMSRISSVMEPGDITHVISNHSEMDHSGNLAHVLHAIQPETVYASKLGKKNLQEHFGIGESITEVADGECLDLGGNKFTFAETRMLHWPDSMITYFYNDSLLFSQDGFGMHLATYERFADEVDKPILDYEAAKYYANILTPLAPIVTKSIDKLLSLNLDLKVIAPDHGPIWRENITEIVEKYQTWAQRETVNKAVVTYDTMWGSTEQMAKAISEGLHQGGLKVVTMPLKGCHRSDIATELLDAKLLAVGSPTINNQIYPTVADLMTYTAGLKFGGLAATSFGSFGWSGEAVGTLKGIVEGMKASYVGDGLKVKFVPDAQALEECRKYGMDLAAQVCSEKS